MEKNLSQLKNKLIKCLNMWTFVSKLTSLLFNMLSRFQTVMLDKTLESLLHSREIE